MDARLPEVAPAPSPALLEANRRLYELREQAQQMQRRPGGPAGTSGAPKAAGGPATDSCRRLSGSAAATVEALPAHLGWGSEALTAVLRQRGRRQAQLEQASAARRLDWLPAVTEQGGAGEGSDGACRQNRPAASGDPPPKKRATLTLYPDIALAMLREEVAAAGRIWWLLRYLDRDGRGMLRIDMMKKQLTVPNSRLRVCGWRQLRNLLHQGEGTFWQRDPDSGRIWLRSAAKVAAALGVERFSQPPVELPPEALCGGMGDVRAHFYASFHSSREPEQGQAMPVARATMERLSGVPARTQQAYDRRAGVESRANYAIGERATVAATQERAWQQGTAVFPFIDGNGQRGPKNGQYIAWQLPNSYSGPHRQRACGRGGRRRLNQKLADLRTKGGAGNGQQKAQDGGSPRDGLYARRYYRNGAAACKAYNRDPAGDRFWYGHRARTGSGLWFVLAG